MCRRVDHVDGVRFRRGHVQEAGAGLVRARGARASSSRASCPPRRRMSILMTGGSGCTSRYRAELRLAGRAATYLGRERAREHPGCSTCIAEPAARSLGGRCRSPERFRLASGTPDGRQRRRNILGALRFVVAAPARREMTLLTTKMSALRSTRPILRSRTTLRGECLRGGVPPLRGREAAGAPDPSLRRRSWLLALQAKARAAPVCLAPARSFVQRGRTGPSLPGAADAAGGVDARRWRIVRSNPAMSAASTLPRSAKIETFELSLGGAGVAAQAGQ